MSEKEKFWHRYRRNRMLELCLNIADLIDEWGHEENPAVRLITDELGLGYRALSASLRDGVKEAVDLQARYRRAIENADLAKCGEKYARDFLEDVFGDRDIDSINDSDKERFRELYKKIQKEWDEQDGE
jgi:hypothetical protein